MIQKFNVALFCELFISVIQLQTKARFLIKVPISPSAPEVVRSGQNAFHWFHVIPALVCEIKPPPSFVFGCKVKGQKEAENLFFVAEVFLVRHL